MKRILTGICFYGCLFFLGGPSPLIGHALAQVQQPLEAIAGSWGTQKQCAQKPIKQDGTQRASPFEISAVWLRHGDFWCQLSWFEPSVRENSLFVVARASCGEDAHRGYSIGFLLERGDPIEELTLFWDEALINGPLHKCAGSK